MQYILQGAQLATGNTITARETIVVLLDEPILDFQWKTLLLGFMSFSDDMLQECIESTRAEYSSEAYGLFYHSCNNFTANFAMFLCGISIPGKIKNLPQDVLNTSFGEFLRPTAGW
jgi:hypothetical protein